MPTPQAPRYSRYRQENGVLVFGRRRLVCRQMVETNGAALVQMVRSIPGDKHLIFEEGTQSAWLYELLEPHVEEVVVVAPGLSDHVKTGQG